ncbi:hypothetical protein RMATCC62417_03539 [Rhizopus microsporus]|nr:hypothetical protein RMATCC62417_03539 [Rhizopus microsporus]
MSIVVLHGRNNIYNENSQLTYDPMEDVMSTTSKPVKVASKRTNADHSINQRTTFIDRMIELPVVQRHATVVGRELGVEERTVQSVFFCSVFCFS